MIRKDYSYLFTTYKEHYMLRKALKVYLNQEGDARKRKEAIRYARYLDKRIAYLQDKVDGRLETIAGREEDFSHWVKRSKRVAQSEGTPAPWEREV